MLWVSAVIDAATRLTLFHSCARCEGGGQRGANQLSEHLHAFKDSNTHSSSDVTHKALTALAMTSRSWLSKRLTLGTSMMRR